MTDTNQISKKILIIGSGPAGYSAAIYAARAGLEPLMVTGMQPGGQLTITTDVENYPGFSKPITGPWLMDEMQNQAKTFGTEILNQTITAVDFSKKPFICHTNKGVTIFSQCVIIATGAQAKWLNVPGESDFMGFGVSGCATCDGFFFRSKNVVVVGGGNTAVEEALFLTHHAAKVTLIHRRDTLRAEKIAQERLFKNPKINVIWNSAITQFKGNNTYPKNLTHINIQNLQTNENYDMEIDGVFVAIGHTPQSKIFQNQIALDSEGYILTKANSTATSVPGVFAAGDVQDKIFRQAITAAGQGCMAALEAEKFITLNQND